MTLGSRRFSDTGGYRRPATQQELPFLPDLTGTGTSDSRRAFSPRRGFFYSAGDKLTPPLDPSKSNRGAETDLKYHKQWKDGIACLREAAAVKRDRFQGIPASAPSSLPPSQVKGDVKRREFIQSPFTNPAYVPVQGNEVLIGNCPSTAGIRTHHGARLADCTDSRPRTSSGPARIMQPLESPSLSPSGSVSSPESSLTPTSLCPCFTFDGEFHPGKHKDNRPLVPRFPAKNSDREIAIPSSSKDKAQQMLQQYKLKEKEQKRKAQAIIESMIKGNDGLEKQADGEVGGRLMGATPSSRWHLVKDELVLKSMLERDRKSKDSWNPEVNPMPMQTDYVLVKKGSKKVLFPELGALRKCFDKMKPDREGHVKYKVLLERIQFARVGERDVSKMKVKLMNRSVGLCGPEERDRASRLAANVFNFQDLLQFNYPNATADELKTMFQMVSPARLAFQKLTRPEVARAVKLFRSMANGTDAVSYERLETCLIERYPKANVYKLLKTFDELVLNRLYLGGTISIEEFVIWYADNVTSGWRVEKHMEANTETGVVAPSDIFSGYIATFNERMADNGKAS